MTVTTREIEYQHEGQTFEGLLAFDDALDQPRPGVMICHAWNGRGEHDELAARRMAEQGYCGFAADVYGKGVKGETKEECTALMTPLMENRKALQGRLQAGLATMAAQAEIGTDQMAVMGFCFGGLCALDLARANASIRGAAAIHALLGETADLGAAPIEPKVIAFHGYDDPLADADAQRAFAEEMTRRQADWQLHLFGGVAHAFTNPGADDPELGLKYDGVASARTAQGLDAFFDALFATT